jgi:hypothetical protein
MSRALEHLQSFEAEAAVWLRRHPYRLIHDRDLQTGEKLLIVDLTEPVPPAFATIIGDCLHNFRSALDNLVYELAIARIGIDPLPERRARMLEFPIIADRTMNSRECRNKIGCIHPDAQAIIKDLQPYQGGRGGRSNLLWVLHELSVKDKHRFPHLGVASAGTISVFAAGSSGTLVGTPNWEPFEGRAEVLRYYSPTGAYAEVDMQRPPTFFVTFGKGAPAAIYGYRVEAVLRGILAYVTRKVIDPLVPYLG